MIWIVPAYFGVGFVFLVVLFAVIGPRTMWYMLTDSDEDDDHFEAWLGVFFTLVVWPITLVFGLGFVVIWLLLYCAKQIAMLFAREGGDE